MHSSNTIECRMVWRDERGAVARPSCHAPLSVGLNAAADNARQLIADMSGASGAVCTGFTLSVRTVVSDTVPSSGQAVNSRAMLIFECQSVANEYAILEIPGISADLVSENGADIDINQSSIQAIADVVINSGFTNPSGIRATRLLLAVVRFEP